MLQRRNPLISPEFAQTEARLLPNSQTESSAFSLVQLPSPCHREQSEAISATASISSTVNAGGSNTRPANRSPCCLIPMCLIPIHLIPWNLEHGTWHLTPDTGTPDTGTLDTIIWLSGHLECMVPGHQMFPASSLPVIARRTIVRRGELLLSCLPPSRAPHSGLESTPVMVPGA